MRLFRSVLLALMALAGLATPAAAQLRVDISGGIQAPMPIAIPTMPTPANAPTPAGSTGELGANVAEIVANDLKGSGLFRPIDGLPAVPFTQVAAPDFAVWQNRSAQALVQGFVQTNPDGTLTVGCYLYDVFLKQELARQGFVVTPNFWRRAAHKCADTVYSRLTGEGPYFDSRIVYISETGPARNRIKRLAIMDQDGFNHRMLTNGQNLVLTPRFNPANQTIVYMSYAGKRPRIYSYDIASGKQRLVADLPNMTFSPRFSPDGRYIVFSMAVGGNTDIYRVSASGGGLTRLTNSPGIDSSASYSPDGSKIVFESDRGGAQQIYVMSADGSGQQRISFGDGRAGTPVWSPRGDLIAFTRMGGGAFRIAVMRPDGGGERVLTNAWQDEGPTWSPNGRVVMFFRTARGSGNPQLWSVDLTGVNERRIPTPLGGSDPAWSPLLP